MPSHELPKITLQIPEVNIINPSNQREYDEEEEEYDRPTTLPVIPRLPLGATVPPLSPFFDERAKKLTLGKAKAQALQDALLNNSQTPPSRSRSSSVTSSSGDTSSDRSGLTTPISETQFSPSIPTIAFHDWTRFGIGISTPNVIKQHDQPPPCYYEMRPPVRRPRSKSSTAIPHRSSKRNAQLPIFSPELAERPNGPPLLLRRATLEGYYCPELYK